MTVKFLAATLSLLCLSWLGLSFTLPTETPADPHRRAFLGSETVSAGHPDSHRLGAVTRQTVELPAWEDRGSQVGTVLTMLVD